MAAPQVYLDTNVFIAAFEHVGAHADHAQWIMRASERGDLRLVTSEMALSELLVKPLELGNIELVEAYKAMFVAGEAFNVVPVSRSILIAAAELRVGRRALKLPDATHVATALAAGCQHFVSDDERMPMPAGLTALRVTPFTVDDILGPPA